MGIDVSMGGRNASARLITKHGAGRHRNLFAPSALATWTATAATAATAATGNDKRPERNAMIRKLKSGGYRLYSRKLNAKTGKRRNLGTFKTRGEAEKHERAVQYFKRH